MQATLSAYVYTVVPGCVWRGLMRDVAHGYAQVQGCCVRRDVRCERAAERGGGHLARGEGAHHGAVRLVGDVCGRNFP